MIQIILLIAGIVYAIRRPKLKSLTAEQFPGVSADVFKQWQTFEIQSVNMFLWATWGLLLIGTPIMFALATSFPGGAMGLQLLYLVIFLVLLAFSAIPGSKAAKLKKQHGIKWPK
jgi:hypothetical protein